MLAEPSTDSAMITLRRKRIARAGFVRIASVSGSTSSTDQPVAQPAPLHTAGGT